LSTDRLQLAPVSLKIRVVLQFAATAQLAQQLLDIDMAPKGLWSAANLTRRFQRSDPNPELPSRTSSVHSRTYSLSCASEKWRTLRLAMS
jgi:hypothetical protein